MIEDRANFGSRWPTLEPTGIEIVLAFVEIAFLILLTGAFVAHFWVEKLGLCVLVGGLVGLLVIPCLSAFKRERRQRKLRQMIKDPGIGDLLLPVPTLKETLKGLAFFLAGLMILVPLSVAAYLWMGQILEWILIAVMGAILM